MSKRPRQPLKSFKLLRELKMWDASSKVGPAAISMKSGFSFVW